MPENLNQTSPDMSEDKKDSETIKSIEVGNKVIELEKKVGQKSEEESDKDAEQWRNEG